jgi:hypothetical protein
LKYKDPSGNTPVIDMGAIEGRVTKKERNAIVEWSDQEAYKAMLMIYGSLYVSYETQKFQAAMDASSGSGGGMYFSGKGPVRLDLDGVKYAMDSPKYKHGYDKHIVKEELFSNLGFTGKWSKDKDLYNRLITDVLINATNSLDGTLGGTAAKGFYKNIKGNQIIVWVYKEGSYAGKVATVVKAYPSQLDAMKVKY